MLCLMLLALFAFIVIRALRHALRNDDPFIRFAAVGLAILFGLQSAINMAVNLHLMPAKGMTLPFISYGGSSMISLAYGMGMLLALTRERPRAEMLARRDMQLGRESGLMAVGRASLSPPAAPAAICFPPRRWPRRWRKRGCRRRAGDRCPRRPLRRRVSAAAPSIVIPERDHPRRAIRCRWPRPASVLGYGVLKAWLHARRVCGRRSWSASAAIRPFRRCLPRRCAAFRP